MRRRILALVLFVTAVAVTTQFVPAALAVRSRDLAAQEVELQRDAAVVAAALPTTDLDDADLAADSSHDYGLYDTAGRLVNGDGPPRAEPAVIAALDGEPVISRAGDELVTALLLPTDNPDRPLLLRVAEPRAESLRASTRSITTLALTALTVIGAAGILAWLLAARLARPVEQLRHTAARLDDGNLREAPAASGIDELDAVAGTLYRTGQRVRATLERERAFSADASHQLRTPLAAMRAAVEAEQIDPRNDGNLVLAELIGQIDRLEITVTQLLALARDTHDDRGPLDLAAVVQAAARRWEQPFAASARRIEVVTPVLDVRPAASASALGHALDVLLDNALQYGTGTVHLTVGDSGAYATVSVADAGRIAGDPSDLFRRRPAGSAGTGIGLHLARTLVETEGGNLQLARPDPTTFELTLPTRRTGMAV